MIRWQPRDGEVHDIGYHEILVTGATAEWLMAGGMTVVNGRPVTLQVMDRLRGIDAVVLKVHGLGHSQESAAFWEQQQAA